MLKQVKTIKLPKTLAEQTKHDETTTKTNFKYRSQTINWIVKDTVNIDVLTCQKWCHNTQKQWCNDKKKIVNESKGKNQQTIPRSWIYMNEHWKSP